MQTLVGELPDAWTIERLGDICDLIPGPGGGALRKTDKADKGVPMLTPDLIYESGCSEHPSRSVTHSASARLKRFTLAEGDIVMARVGSRSKVALLGEHHAGWVLGSSCLRLRVTDRLVASFLICYLSHPSVQAWLTSQTQRTVVPTLNTGVVRDLPVALPPLSEQKIIGATLRSIDTKVRNAERILLTLQEMRRETVRTVFPAGLHGSS